MNEKRTNESSGRASSELNLTRDSKTTKGREKQINEIELAKG